MRSTEMKLEFNNVIKNLFNHDKISKFRRASMVQQIRKNALRYIIVKNISNDKIINNYIETINKLLDINVNNIAQLFKLDLTDYFEINKKKEFIHSSNKSKNFTYKANDIINLCEKNKFNKFSLIVHGSQADGGTTNFSDLDISIFIKDEIFNDQEEFAKTCNQIAAINRRVYYWDNLSHHGTFINLENDFLCYPESFMPLEVLKKGIIPLDHTIKINGLRDSLDLLFENFINISNTIIKIINNTEKINLINLKNLISSYYMLIIIEFEIRQNKFLDKKEIFTKYLPEYLDSHNYQTFQIFSDIRKNWPNNKDNCSIGVSQKLLQKMFLHIEIMSKNIQSDKILNNIKNKFLK